MPYKDIEKKRACGRRWYHRNKKLKGYTEKHRRRYYDGKRIKNWLEKQYENQPCMDCGKCFPYCAMEFDHRGDEPKEFCVSQLNSYSASPKNIAIVMKEVSKCDFVCACCHKIRTWKRLQ